MQKPTYSSATLSMAWASANFTIKLVRALKEEKNILTCAFVLSDICATKYFELPIAIGRSGTEKDFGLPRMNNFERELLHKAVPELKKDVQKGIDFVQKEQKEKKLPKQ